MDAREAVLRVVVGALGCPDRWAELGPRDEPSWARYALACEALAFARLRPERADEPRPLSRMERAYRAVVACEMLDLAERAERLGCGPAADMLAAAHLSAFELVGGLTLAFPSAGRIV